MILFIVGPVDWEGRPVDWRAWETWMGEIRYRGRGCVIKVDWGMLRELRVWKRKRIRSDERQTNKWTNRISTYRLDPRKGSSKNTSNVPSCVDFYGNCKCIVIYIEYWPVGGWMQQAIMQLFVGKLSRSLCPLVPLSNWAFVSSFGSLLCNILSGPIIG